MNLLPYGATNGVFYLFDIYDKKSKLVSFKKGDNVFHLERPKSHKFSYHYDGLGEILQKFPNGSFEIKIKNKTMIIHPMRLKIKILKPREIQERMLCLKLQKGYH